MIYVVDTHILSLLAHKDSPEAPRIRRRIAQLPSEHLIVTTIINYEEQMRGWMAILTQARSSKSEIQIYARLADHLATFRRMTVLEYTSAAATLVDGFRRQKLKIGTMDLKIAAIAVSANAVLVTRNSSDFRKIPGLQLQDWSVE
jgi:tRNA(fMet)-specific endonuclease VapC